MRTITSILLIFCVLGTFAGCYKVGSGDAKRYKELGVANVTGTITFDGRPLPYAQITFEPGGTYGVTDRNGKYQMWVNSKRTGSLPGDKVVRIWTTKRGLGFDALMKDNAYPAEETIPIEYNRESKLTITVNPNKSQVHNFDLKSGGKVDPKGATALGDDG